MEELGELYDGEVCVYDCIARVKEKRSWHGGNIFNMCPS